MLCHDGAGKLRLATSARALCRRVQFRHLQQVQRRVLLLSRCVLAAMTCVIKGSGGAVF